jgi:hypothetical protein
MDVRLAQLAATQDDIVAAWQLVHHGWTLHAIAHQARRGRWRPIHDGVFALGQAPLTQRQRWIAATLTAPNTYLAGASAAACWEFRPWDGAFETVVRPGSGGPRRHGPLLVARSTTLDGATTFRDGIPIVTATRALIDLAPHLGTRQLGKAFREAIRLKATTASEVSRALRGQRGTAFLVALCDRYATIPYHRCRSAAESRGLEILHDAGIESPDVNVRISRKEADFSWPRHRLIIEIDGPQFHLFADEDARKQAIWEAAGHTVRRIPSGDVFDHPHRLIALAPQTNVQI